MASTVIQSLLHVPNQGIPTPAKPPAPRMENCSQFRSLPAAIPVHSLMECEQLPKAVKRHDISSRKESAITQPLNGSHIPGNPMVENRPASPPPHRFWQMLFLAMQVLR